ncbi:MAG: hypothetical protein RLZZ249_1095 [Actinomycetota bacterium]|jgi:hypothetical protein
MFKNTTRRGLAIASALSLAFAGLVSAPASANVAFELKPSAGTSYTTFVTETFTLETVLGSANPNGGNQLKYAVSKESGFAVDAVSSTDSAATLTDKEVLSGSTSKVISAVGATQTSRNYLRLAVDNASSASSSVTVTVTAFIDVDNDGAVDTAEPQSAQTVSFKKYSDVASVVTVTQGAEGDTAVKATASFTGVNEDQLTAAEKRVHFAVSGSALASSVAATAGVFTSVDSVTLAKDATVSAYVVYKGTKIGETSATMTVTNKTVKALTLSAVTGDNVIASGSAAAKARLNTSFALKANVKDAATTTASAVAGADVVFEVSTSATLTATKTLAVNGTTYTSSTALPKTLTIKSDASGDAVVTLLPTGFSTSDTVTLIAKSQNNTTPNLVVSFETATYTVTSDTHGFLKVAGGTEFTVNYSVKDQWGVLTTKADRISAAYAGTTKYVNLAAGKAAVSFTSTTSAGSLNVTNGALEEQNSSTLNWSSVAGATLAGNVAVLVTTTADSFDVSPVATASANIARATTSGDIKLTNAVSLTGSVNNAGAKVTVTGTGVKFAAPGDKAVSEGSISLNTDGSGNFTVSAYVQKAGTATITYTVGTATKSTVVTVAAPAGTEGSVLDVTSNAAGNTIEPGKTIVAKISLKDELGNAVEAKDSGTESFGVTVTGLGFVGALPVALNSSGEATVTVLLGSADEGNVVITASYSKDGSTANAITKVLTIAVAKAAAPEVNAVIGTYNGRWAVRVENAKGSVVSVKVGGNWFKYTSLNENYLFSRKSVVGRTLAVAVYVNGQLENVATIVVK